MPWRTFNLHSGVAVRDTLDSSLPPSILRQINMPARHSSYLQSPRNQNQSCVIMNLECHENELNFEFGHGILKHVHNWIEGWRDIRYASPVGFNRIKKRISCNFRQTSQTKAGCAKLAIMPTQSEKIRKTGHTGHISLNWYHSHGQLASFQRGSPVHPFPHNSSHSWKVCPLLHLHLVVKHQHRRVLQVVRGLRPGHGLSRRACVQIVRRHSLRRMPIPLRASWNYHLSAVMWIEGWGMFWWSPAKLLFEMEFDDSWKIDENSYMLFPDNTYAPKKLPALLISTGRAAGTSTAHPEAAKVKVNGATWKPKMDKHDEGSCGSLSTKLYTWKF